MCIPLGLKRSLFLYIVTYKEKIGKFKAHTHKKKLKVRISTTILNWNIPKRYGDPDEQDSVLQAVAALVQVPASGVQWFVAGQVDQRQGLAHWDRRLRAALSSVAHARASLRGRAHSDRLLRSKEQSNHFRLLSVQRESRRQSVSTQFDLVLELYREEIFRLRTKKINKRFFF